MGHSWISGAFSNSCMLNPSPHPTKNVGCVYPEFFYEFQLSIGWTEGQLQGNFEDALFYEGTLKLQKNYEYCSTLQRTSVHHCGYDPGPICSKGG